MKKVLSTQFFNLQPELLEAWFEAKIAKYPNSRTKEHLESVYSMLIGDTVRDDTLNSFYLDEWEGVVK